MDDIESIKEQINGVNWAEYDGPEFYNSKRVPEALIDLLGLDVPERAEDVGDSVINAIGSNHAGSYYPAVIAAIDILISMEKSCDNKVRKICTCSILSDLYYFEPELGSYSGHTYDEIEAIVCSKLKPYK